MKQHTYDANGRYWYRCLECGDSVKDKQKAHAIIDRYGKTYCFRCQYASSISMDTFIDCMVLNTISIEEAIEKSYTLPELHKTKLIERKTMLETYTGNNYNDVVFKMNNHKAEMIGQHIRDTTTKHFSNNGRRGIGYNGIPKSSQSDPLYVVEGPFDVITDRHVCVFGSIGLSSLKYLKYQYLWLWPDPDWIDTTKKQKRFYNLIQKANMNGCMIQGVVVSNDDPDCYTIRHDVRVGDYNDFFINQ